MQSQSKPGTNETNFKWSWEYFAMNLFGFMKYGFLSEK